MWGEMSAEEAALNAVGVVARMGGKRVWILSYALVNEEP